jgi:general secretion pathway protein J
LAGPFPVADGIMADRPPAASGFTLLETLVVLAVLGLLFVGLTQGIRAGLALWRAQDRRIEQTAELDSTARLLRTLLTRMSSPTGPAGQSQTILKGGSNRLEFIGDLPTGLGATQRADIVIELLRRRLVLVWTPRRHEVPVGSPPKPVETELMGSVQALDLGYWGTPAPDQSPGWQPSWDGPGLPQLIRVRLAFAAGDPRRWPDLIVAPQP